MPLSLRRLGRTPGPLVVREGRLHGGLPYLVVGQGPPLVVVSAFTAEHANPTGAARRFSLEPLAPLAQRFTVHLVNRKPGLQAGCTVKDLAGDYAHALERALAGRRMQRDLARFTLAGQPRRAWAATGPALATTAVGGRLAAGLLWLVGPRMHPRDPSDMLATIAAEDRFDAAGQLHRISTPTLVIAGDRDRYYTPGLFRETAARIPGVRLRLYTGKGHASIATLTYKPAVREILGFLTDQPTPSHLHEARWRAS